MPISFLVHFNIPAFFSFKVVHQLHFILILHLHNAALSLLSFAYIDSYLSHHLSAERSPQGDPADALSHV